MNTQRVEGHTPATMGELVKAHASRDTMSTHHGFEMLELSGAAEHTCAANTYLAALSVIRKQEKVNEALVRLVEEYVALEEADHGLCFPNRDKIKAAREFLASLAKEPA